MALPLVAQRSSALLSLFAARRLAFLFSPPLFSSAAAPLSVSLSHVARDCARAAVDAMRLALPRFSAEGSSVVATPYALPRCDEGAAPPTAAAAESAEAPLVPLDNGILTIQRTFQPSMIRRKRRHGFLARNATTTGQKLIARRVTKGRRRLSI